MHPQEVIEWLRFVWAWLGEQGPMAQPGVVLALAWGIPWLLRTYLAEQWEAATNWATSKAKPLLGEKLAAAFRKAIQGVPSLAIGAALGVILHGGDVGAILSDQFYVVFAPLLHEAFKRYQGGAFPAAGGSSGGTIVEVGKDGTVKIEAPVVRLGSVSAPYDPTAKHAASEPPKDGAA